MLRISLSTEEKRKAAFSHFCTAVAVRKCWPRSVFGDRLPSYGGGTSFRLRRGWRPAVCLSAGRVILGNLFNLCDVLVEP